MTDAEQIPQLRQGTEEFAPDLPITQGPALRGEGKIKRRVTFYGRNQDTKIEEVKLLDVARDLASAITGEKLSIEDFIRSAALQVAAQMVIREKRRQLEEQAKEDAASAASVDGSTSETQTEGVENGMVGQQSEVQQQAEVPAAGAGEAADGVVGG